jgi:hypothetical protein
LLHTLRKEALACLRSRNRCVVLRSGYCSFRPLTSFSCLRLQFKADSSCKLMAKFVGTSIRSSIIFAPHSTTSPTVCSPLCTSPELEIRDQQYGRVLYIRIRTSSECKLYPPGPRHITQARGAERRGCFTNTKNSRPHPPICHTHSFASAVLRRCRLLRLGPSIIHYWTSSSPLPHTTNAPTKLDCGCELVTA